VLLCIPMPATRRIKLGTEGVSEYVDEESEEVSRVIPYKGSTCEKGESEEGNDVEIEYQGDSEAEEPEVFKCSFRSEAECDEFMKLFKKSGKKKPKKGGAGAGVDANSYAYDMMEGIVFVSIVHIEDRDGNGTIDAKDKTEFCKLVDGFDCLGAKREDKWDDKHIKRQARKEALKSLSFKNKCKGSVKRLPQQAMKNPLKPGQQYVWYPVPIPAGPDGLGDKYTCCVVHAPEENLAIFSARGERLKDDPASAQRFVDGVLAKFLSTFPTKDMRVGPEGALTETYQPLLERMVDKFNELMRDEYKTKDEMNNKGAAAISDMQKGLDAQAEKTAMVDKNTESSGKLKDKAASYKDTAKAAADKYWWLMMYGFAAIGVPILLAIIGFIVYMSVGD